MNTKRGFKCLHCGQLVKESFYIGTKHRNHCPFCLWSKHVDLKTPGDRKSVCGAGMKPIGLIFKHEGFDKYGNRRQGELMLVHQCINSKCGKISINRIAGDDKPEMVLEIFRRSQKMARLLRKKLKEENIELLTKKDEKEVKTQLFGKND